PISYYISYDKTNVSTLLTIMCDLFHSLHRHDEKCMTTDCIIRIVSQNIFTVMKRLQYNKGKTVRTTSAIKSNRSKTAHSCGNLMRIAINKQTFIIIRRCS